MDDNISFGCKNNLDSQITPLYEVIEDSCDIQRIDEILTKLKKIDPDSFEKKNITGN